MKRPVFFGTLSTLFACLLFVVPEITHAASTTFQVIVPINQCNCAGLGSAPDWGCVLQTLQAVLEDVVVFATIIITVLIAWAGVSFMMSPTSAEARSKARARLVNAVLGLLIVLCAWLLINSLLGVIYNASAVLPGGTGTTIGAWNSLLVDTNTADGCIAVIKTRQNLPGLNPGGNATGATGATLTPAAGATPASGAIPSAICNAANAYRGTSTASGPSGGVLACAWSVNNVLANAGIYNIGGNSVQAMENALKGGRGTAVSQSAAVCGDLVIEAGDGHVGVCLNSGCSQVLSNSSSNASFTWVSAPTFAPSYSNGVGRFYQVTN